MRHLRKKLNTIFAVWLSGYLVLLQLATTSPELHQFMHGAWLQQSIEHGHQYRVADGEHDHQQCAVALLALGILPVPSISYHFGSQQVTKPASVRHDSCVVVASAKDFNPRDPPQPSPFRQL